MIRALIIFITVWLAGIAVIFTVFMNIERVEVDTVAVNDALMSGDISLSELLQQEHARMESERQSRDFKLQIFLYGYTGFVALAGALLFVYCEKSVLKPFRKLQSFARRIAAGNLDIPLEMDKSNLFGAFTESFDLMRVELKQARENERAADRSKKELVASLSHDIKTPVASIKAVTELMLVTAKLDKEIQQLEIINAKAEQVNSLITNMFHATLEELQALSVTLAEVPSTAISGLIKSADYERKVRLFRVPNCLVNADLMRLQQVFDNIIGNSYKYANTEITVTAKFDENHLVIEVSDFGAGVAEDELPLILNKFYRGKNTETKSGYGLGLHISKYLLEQMDGDLQCENSANGFTVKLYLKLAS
ncbi:MAG: HAMP domain-containing histidine kinase [Oscillospiraceae bacterium]|nr:HAMP domain-containing histidine kinase [Oscillospiraceae bacterium]